MEQLSSHDRAVIEAIFDPLQILSTAQRDTNENEPSDPNDVISDPNLNELLKRAIMTADAGKLDEALVYFNEVRHKAPNVPSVLNDRAQALRLVGRIDEALKDLNEAIEMTGGIGKTATKALCQRALIHRYLGHQEESKMDFENAAKGGSAFAKTQLAKMNPYAALCNAMLREISAKSVAPPP